MYKKPKVVVIGGGTGLSVLLRGLKHFPLDITAIVTVADDGGSSGILRTDFNIPAPGDLRNVMTAMCDAEPVLEELFKYRFKGDGDLSGHALGNLLLTAMIEITGDVVSGVKNLSKVLNVKGKILPSTGDSLTLMAELHNGEVVEGESTIPNSNEKIKRVFFKEKAKAVKEAVDAIKEAEFIIYSIGSLYTSIIPNLLIDEIRDSIVESKAIKYYIANVMEQPGETIGYTCFDHIEAIKEHLKVNDYKQIIDKVIIDNTKLDNAIINKYLLDGAKKVFIDENRFDELNIDVIKAKIIQISKDNTVRHQSYKLASIIYSSILEQHIDKEGWR